MSADNEEFLAHFEPLRERLWRFIRAMVYRWDTADADLAQDIMSETVLCVLERFHELRDKQAFLAFCFTVAHRTHKNAMRRRKHWTEMPEGFEENMLSREPSPELHSDVRALYAALDALPPKIKEAVVLFELSDLSLESIRVIQGGTLSGVKSRIRRGREQLSTLLCEQKQTRDTSESSGQFNHDEQERLVYPNK